MRAVVSSVGLLVATLAACGSGDRSDGFSFNQDNNQIADDNLPATCAEVRTWDAAWNAFEDEVLRLTNIQRTIETICGVHGLFAPTTSLSQNNNLRCAARRMSKDMAVRDFFDHTNPDGVGPDGRVTDAGYDWQLVGENIAAGQTTPAEVVQAWVASDGHCANLMAPDFDELGVGYYYEATDPYRHFWTQNFGTPL